jgi:hypothetical protein
MLLLTWLAVTCLALAAITLGAQAAVDWATQRRRTEHPPVDACCCGMVDMHDPDIVAWHVGPERHSRGGCDFDG